MGLSTHAYGGTRMGDNPRRTLSTAGAFSHEAPNLGILGACVMGTSGAHNPTLTAQALAWRTAEHLAKNWQTIGRMREPDRAAGPDMPCAIVIPVLDHPQCRPHEQNS